VPHDALIIFHDVWLSFDEHLRRTRLPPRERAKRSRLTAALGVYELKHAQRTRAPTASTVPAGRTLTESFSGALISKRASMAHGD